MLASWLATARSGLPSPLKSPTATDAGPSPVSTLAAGPKLAAVSAIAGDATRAANSAHHQDGETHAPHKLPRA